MPTIDEVNRYIFGLVFAVVGVRSGKVTDALISQSRCVAGVGWDLANGVIQRLQLTTSIRHLVSQFNVVWEDLVLDELGQCRISGSSGGRRRTRWRYLLAVHRRRSPVHHEVT